MKQYFYLLHPYLPHQVTFQVPMLIAAENLEVAKRVAEEIRIGFEKVFKFAISPSDPVPSDNDHSVVPANMFFTMLEEGVHNGECISIDLPQEFAHQVSQPNFGAYCNSLKGLVIIGEGHQSRYGLQ